MASLAPSGVAAMSASLVTVGNPLRSGRQRAALPPAARTATAKRHRGEGQIAAKSPPPGDGGDAGMACAH